MKIGNIKLNNVVEFGTTANGFVYKDDEAFLSNSGKICYIPELWKDIDDDSFLITKESNTYTFKDFLDIAECFVKNNKEVLEYCTKSKTTLYDIALDLFETVDWQHPETLIEDWVNRGAYTE